MLTLSSSTSASSSASSRRRTVTSLNSVVGLLLLLSCLLPSSSTTVFAVAFSEDEGPITMQWKLGKFGIQLSPTPEILLDLEVVLAPIVEKLVRARLQDEIGEPFQYMLLSSIDSVERDDGGANRRRRLNMDMDMDMDRNVDENSWQRTLASEVTTTIIFSGGVVALNQEPTKDINALIRETIEAELAGALSDRSFNYAEVAQATFLDLQPPPPAPEDLDLDDSPTTTTIDGVTVADFVAQEEDGNDKSLAKILGSTAAALFVAVAAAFLLVHAKRRRQSQQERYHLHQAQSSLSIGGDPENQNNEQADSFVDEVATVVDEEDEDSDQSEMAQYAPGELLDSVSVGSEWTATTNDDSKLDSSIQMQRNNNNSNRMGSDLASISETFIRDRSINLQKDMLQSQWSSAITNTTNNNHSILPAHQQRQTTLLVNNTSSKDLKFSQAQEGEEVYLMPPSRVRRPPASQSVEV